jgi:hypothetical protein
MLILTWLAPRRSLTSPSLHVQKSLRLLFMPNFAVATGNNSRQAQDFSPYALRPFLQRNAVSKTTQPDKPT